MDVIEALFDDMTARAGMQNMRAIMQSSDPAWMTGAYLRLMVNLWSQDRVLIRRIQATNQAQKCGASHSKELIDATASPRSSRSDF